jgi:hypothetical protein
MFVICSEFGCKRFWKDECCPDCEAIVEELFMEQESLNGDYIIRDGVYE